MSGPHTPCLNSQALRDGVFRREALGRRRNRRPTRGPRGNYLLLQIRRRPAPKACQRVSPFHSGNPWESSAAVKSLGALDFEFREFSADTNAPGKLEGSNRAKTPCLSFRKTVTGWSVQKLVTTTSGYSLWFTSIDRSRSPPTSAVTGTECVQPTRQLEIDQILRTGGARSHRLNAGGVRPAVAVKVRDDELQPGFYGEIAVMDRTSSSSPTVCKRAENREED